MKGLESADTVDSQQLTQEDLEEIHEAFYQSVVPKLQRLGARLGNIDCSFAGPQYKNWVATFVSQGDDFQITAVEYDPDANTLDLDL